MKSAAFHTLGCKVNAYETEAMKQKLLEAGYTLRSFDERADVYVINTCSVTNIADRKSRQMLHRARHLNPDAVIVAAGCYAQAAAEELRKDEAVDIVLGNAEKKDLVPVLEAWFRNGREQFVNDAGDISAVRCYDDFAAGSMTEHTRAFLKIQDGCNQFCSYCIIPYLRGRVRSRRPEEVTAEAEKLAAEGYREMVLTGIHLSSYGTDFGPDAELRDLPGLLRALDGIDGVDRIRLGSLEPEIVTERFVAELSAVPSFCPHFHLSLQSGCDETLKRMNRHYTTAEYLHGVELIRSSFPDAAVTTDVIVGFPGETEEEFAATVGFLKQVRFYETHIFPYSRREGTKAASMPGQLTAREKAERAKVLAELNAEMSASYRRARIGKTEELLSEEKTDIGGVPYITGSTREYVKVAVPYAENRLNRLINGEIESFLTPEIMLMRKIISVS